MKSVGIILPTYNSGEFLDLQVYSILCQHNVNVELYIMDDESDDNTKSKIIDLEKKFPNIHILESPNKFGNASKSFFYMLVELFPELKKHDFIALSDHDDVWMPHKLITGLEVLNRTNSHAYSSDYLSANYRKDKGFSAPHISKKNSKPTGYDHYFEGPGAGCTFIVSSEFYSGLVSFICKEKNRQSLDKIFWHDWFMYIFAIEHGYKWIIDGSPHILYLQHESNETGVNRGLKAGKKRLKMLSSGWYFEQIKLMLDIISPKNDINLRLKRLSLFDKLFFLKKIFRLRRIKKHSLIMAFFLFRLKTKDN